MNDEENGGHISSSRTRPSGVLKGTQVSTTRTRTVRFDHSLQLHMRTAERCSLCEKISKLVPLVLFIRWVCGVSRSAHVLHLASAQHEMMVMLLAAPVLVRGGRNFGTTSSRCCLSSSLVEEVLVRIRSSPCCATSWWWSWWFGLVEHTANVAARVPQAGVVSVDVPYAPGDPAASSQCLHEARLTTTRAGCTHPVAVCVCSG